MTTKHIHDLIKFEETALFEVTPILYNVWRAKCFSCTLSFQSWIIDELQNSLVGMFLVVVGVDGRT